MVPDPFIRLRRLEARLDALRRCSTGYACGNTCISPAKECRSSARATTGKQRLRRLEQLAQGAAPGRGIGQLRGEGAAAKAEQIRTARSEQAQQLLQQRQQRRRPGGAITTTATTVLEPEVMQPRTTTTGRPPRMADQLRETLAALKASDARQMGLVAEQLFEAGWSVQRRTRYRGMTKAQAREAFKAELLNKMQAASTSPEAQQRQQQQRQRIANAGSVSGGLKALVEELKAGDDRLQELTQQAIDLRVATAGMEGGDPEAGLGGTPRRRRLR